MKEGIEALQEEEAKEGESGARSDDTQELEFTMLRIAGTLGPHNCL